MRLHSIILICILLFQTPGNSENLVKTRIHSKWKQTSILAEIGEYLADQDESLFWKFVDIVHLDNQDINKMSDLDLYNIGISTAARLLSSSEMNLLRFSISTRIYSPRTEVHRQLFLKFKPEKCSLSAFFVFGNQKGCQLNQLDVETYDENGSNEGIFPFDHIYPINSAANRTIFIYGSLGSREFHNLIVGARKIVKKEVNLRFIVRFSDFPATKPSSGFSVSLSGYGVELAIKNTEYKAVDTSKKENLPEDLHGLNFQILQQRHPDNHKELGSLIENLEKVGEIVPLKKWQLADLGYKTCEKIRESGLNLKKIEKILQDFPSHARPISHLSLNETRVKSVKKIQELLQSSGIGNGLNVLAINGRVITTRDERIDLFSLIETMKEEKKVLEDLMDIGFKLKDEEGKQVDHSKLLTLLDFTPIDLTTKAFDYRTAEPVFLNNVESKGGPYKSIHLLLQPFPPDQIRPISRNIFNLIFFLDPFDSDDKLMDLVDTYLKSKVYIRIGVVPFFNEREHGMAIDEAVKSKPIPTRKNRIWSTKNSLIEALQKGNRFLANSGLSKAPHALLNGYQLDVSSLENFDAILQENVQKQTIRLQMMIYHGRIDDNVKIDEWWLTKATNPDIVARINQKIVTAFNDRRFLKLDEKELFDIITRYNRFPKSSRTSLKSSNVSTWIVTNFQNPVNRVFVANILKSAAKTDDKMIAIISNPGRSSDNSDSKSCNIEYEDLEHLIETLESTDNCIESTVPSEFLLKNGINPGETAIVSNGLIIGPFTNEEDYLKVEDFEYLDRLWNEKGAGRTSEFFKQQHNDNDVNIKFFSTMARMYRKDVSRISFDEFKNSENSITFPPEIPKIPSVTITWLSNPVSREAQQIISIVKLMSKVLNARVEIIFNPASEILENPIKRFYRFVAKEELEFDEFGAIRNHSAVFSNLPQKQLLTMSIETNDGWMIEVKEAEHDLDNILLESTSADVESVYSLEHILVEGQSRKLSGEASDGLEIELQSENTTYDTLVMLNLGYYQLKAEPGVWNLRLREGSSSEKYRFVKVDSKQVENNIAVVVDSFTGKWLQLVVDEIDSKKEPEPSKIKTLIDNAKSFFSTPAPSETINVFSLASGHLYERFMRIMIVSVMKNTKTQKVKFWLLKNYLSPKFKESIPLLADFYGFDYELVEYKWPKWLHQQTEKQRVMWGYKILFLDVLFPLNVDKIIFVDADQVVRADLQELMDFNLKGAPYGYVPFCESRKEMEGFRFWKSGYWNNHLMGRRYHISALYVVDLKAFREFSAGDRLRGRYDSLSADPNSLSNLDQDLPNNMIHEVPIKSLPQDWLWCETWCDENSKKTAKTIDLCNNPLTKEPKLKSAQRIIGEWKNLDEEISNVIKKDDRIKRSKLPESVAEKEEL